MSMYSQDLDLNIVADEKWWADTYDIFSYGKDYDFQTPFFSQFHALLKVTPLPHLQRAYSTFENSDFCNAAAGLKNCYLVTNADNCEDCMYGFYIEECKDCLDTMFSNTSELCYQSINLNTCYECMYCEDCENSSNLLFCKDCVSCKHCFGCVGLHQKTYHIYNKPYTKEEYEQKMSEMHTGSWSQLQKLQEAAKEFFLNAPYKYVHGRNNENVQGDYIYISKDVQESFIVKNAEKCKFSHLLQYLSSGTHDAYDYTMFGVGADLVYEAAWCGLGIHNVKFSLWNYGASDLEYCIGCHYSSKLFGCIGLRHKEHCILNKQYSKEEYEEMVPKIKEQMMQVPYKDRNGVAYGYGEFFPIELSPFHYNQTIAQDYCPLTESECVNRQYGWYKREERAPQDAIHWQELPDAIENVDESFLKKTIRCKAYDDNPQKAAEHNCTEFFKITAQELEFYKKMNLPIPRYCFNSRHNSRLRQINPFKMWQRTCAKCNREIQTTYNPERPEIVYCEECYLQSVY